MHGWMQSRRRRKAGRVRGGREGEEKGLGAESERTAEGGNAWMQREVGREEKIGWKGGNEGTREREGGEEGGKEVGGTGEEKKKGMERGALKN